METEFRLTVNGAERSVICEPDAPLLDVLRHGSGLGRTEVRLRDGAVRGVLRAHRGARPLLLRPADLNSFTEQRWVTIQHSGRPAYPF